MCVLSEQLGGKYIIDKSVYCLKTKGIKENLDTLVYCVFGVSLWSEGVE